MVCEVISISFNITVALLEEFLRNKVLSTLDHSLSEKTFFQLYINTDKIIELKKKINVKEPLSEDYSLGEIAKFINSQKGSLHLLFKIVFDNETVFPNILKKLPNAGFISDKMIPKLSKKIRKIKKQKKRDELRNRGEKSIINLDSNYRQESNAMFGGNFLNPDYSNIDGYGYQNSFHNYKSKKNSLSFGKRDERGNSNNYLFKDFGDIQGIIESNDLHFKKRDSNKIGDKEEDNNRSENLIGNTDKSANSIGLLNNRANPEESNKTKRSAKYDEGVEMLYDKIKGLN